MLEQEITKEINLINSIASEGNHLEYSKWLKFKRDNGFDIASIDRWIWEGTPKNNQYIQRFVNKMILDASMEECITSPSEYIRECKKFFLGDSEKWIKIKWCYDSKMSKAS